MLERYPRNICRCDWMTMGMSVLLMGCVLLISPHLADAAETSMSCPHTGCHGYGYNITCDISGNITSGVRWVSPEREEVASCSPGNECEVRPGYRLVVQSLTRHVLEVTRFSPGDTGRWACQDGYATPIKYCENVGIAPPTMSQLELACTKEKEHFLVKCSGLHHHGNPPVLLTLSGPQLEVNSTSGKMVKLHGDRLSGEEFTCQVSGDALQCLHTDVTTVILTHCPGPSCMSINTYLIVSELILMISGLFNLVVLYLGTTDTGQEMMVDKGILWLLGIVIAALLLLLGTVHVILLAQFCTAARVLTVPGATMCGVALVVGLGLLIISVLKKACARHHRYDVPEDLKLQPGGSSGEREDDTDELDDSEK